MKREDVSRWLAAYIEAWKSYDRDRIGALFSEDAVLSPRPPGERHHLSCAAGARRGGDL